jgi:hypothetical protein
MFYLPVKTTDTIAGVGTIGPSTHSGKVPFGGGMLPRQLNYSSSPFSFLGRATIAAGYTQLPPSEREA